MLGVSPPSTHRRRIEVRGIVQGVGFRPFVYRLAEELELRGWVRNDASGVTLEVEGDAARVESMAERIAAEAPVLARVDAVAVSPPLALRGEAGFAIVANRQGRATTVIGPDTAVCSDCLAELFDPADRRYRYPFINCTHCGPRYTITRELPYERAMTSMQSFVQCTPCRTEYRDPRHRRFHAEPNACRACGPGVTLVDGNGVPLIGTDEDAIAATLARLRAGAIVALKGLGGFHLACDARNATAVAALRARKHRDEKPFAVMVANSASAAQWAVLDAPERALLAARERPIVLLRKRPAAEALPGVAPGLAWLGVMLPYTPLQYLLFHEAAGRPRGCAWLDGAQDLVLVMTSANPGGEPLVTGNAEALERLAGIADAWLVHDRDIVVRCDDSVVRASPGPGGLQFIRRARGYTPRSVRLAAAAPPVLAVGGLFKSAICVTRADEAFLSEHVGDLDNAATCVALERAVAHLVAILEVEPAVVAHDLHPDFFSTQHAALLAERWGVPLHAVQHHHAHIGAVLAEHQVDAPVLGLALDGVGLGSDGGAWGGELLEVDRHAFVRLGRLRPLRLPGGDRAAREPWRMACAALAAGGRGASIGGRFVDQPAARTVAAMLERGFNVPETSSAGRWFDAAAGLLGVKPTMRFEGQAAMLLEGLAERHGPVAADASLFALEADGTLDLMPLAMRLADCDDAGYGAALFHATLIMGLAEWITAAAQQRNLATVACGGGCFLNAILARGLRAALRARGITMLEAHAAPPNDGGLALGQAYVAQHALRAGLVG